MTTSTEIYFQLVNEVFRFPAAPNQQAICRLARAYAAMTAAEWSTDPHTVQIKRATADQLLREVAALEARI
jgi:hypothetical protein